MGKSSGVRLAARRKAIRDSKKRKTCPDVAASRQAAGMGRTGKTSSYTRSHSTTSAVDRQLESAHGARKAGCIVWGGTK